MAARRKNGVRLPQEGDRLNGDIFATGHAFADDHHHRGGRRAARHFARHFD
jgi:hypothetical protein